MYKLDSRKLDLFHLLSSHFRFKIMYTAEDFTDFYILIDCALQFYQDKTTTTQNVTKENEHAIVTTLKSNSTITKNRTQPYQPRTQKSSFTNQALVPFISPNPQSVLPTLPAKKETCDISSVNFECKQINDDTACFICKKNCYKLYCLYTDQDDQDILGKGNFICGTCFILHFHHSVADVNDFLEYSSPSFLCKRCLKSNSGNKARVTSSKPLKDSVKVSRERFCLNCIKQSDADKLYDSDIIYERDSGRKYLKCGRCKKFKKLCMYMYINKENEFDIRKNCSFCRNYVKLIANGNI